MSESRAKASLLEILNLCLTIEGLALKMYQYLAAQAENDGLKLFWCNLADDEKRHIAYLKKLIALAKKDLLPFVFDDPDTIKKELGSIVSLAEHLLQEDRLPADVHDAFILAYRLEFYLLHPSFAALFHLMKDHTEGLSPEDDYDQHLMKLIKGFETYAGSTPEILLIEEILGRLWKNNRHIAEHMRNIITLRSLVPICMSCKKVRDSEGYWEQVEAFMHKYTEASFTHSLCPECMQKLYPKIYQKYKERLLAKPGHV